MEGFTRKNDDPKLGTIEIKGRKNDSEYQKQHRPLEFSLRKMKNNFLKRRTKEIRDKYAESEAVEAAIDDLANPWKYFPKEKLPSEAVMKALDDPESFKTNNVRKMLAFKDGIEETVKSTLIDLREEFGKAINLLDHLASDLSKKEQSFPFSGKYDKLMNQKLKDAMEGRKEKIEMLIKNANDLIVYTGDRLRELSEE